MIVHKIDYLDKMKTLNGVRKFCNILKLAIFKKNLLQVIV